MKIPQRFASLAFLGWALPALAAGTWVPLVNSPAQPTGHFLLLSDGTVMAEANPYGFGQAWYRLAPDIHGSYVNGTWTNMASMNYTRLDFASVVLKDGRVLVAGGEYGTGAATAEVYDPVANTWTVVPVPTSLLNPALPSPEVGENQEFSDSIAKIVANGKVLIAPVAGNAFGATMLFDPTSNTWAAGPQTIRRAYPDQAEASWVKLPDDSILTVDSATTTSERYIPASNSWVSDANCPVALFDPYGIEEGPGLLLPNGKAIFFGGTSHTAIYSPSGTTSPGTWVTGPDFPNSQGMPDAPAAMMVNGKILCATCRAPYQLGGTNYIFNSPTSFYEYDYVANTFTQVSAPGGGSTLADVVFPALMVDLPDGTVLFGHRQRDFYVYQPDGTPLAAGKPTIISITTNLDGSLHLTGTLFNGLSEGSAYGDDEQMDSNFPLVRFTDISGNVRYGRTYNWSRTSVMTGSAVVSTECAIPPGASPADLIQVVANGIASDVPSTVVYTTTDSGPGSLRQAVSSAAPGSVIIFDPTLSGQNITLTSGEIALNKNLTIDGSALAQGIRLNGNHNSRIFNIGSGVSIALNSLTITNGHTTAANWGGAIANSGTLALNYCTLAGNSVDPNGAGGAIENGGPLTLTGCTFSGNSGGYAGAIDNRSVCTAQNCTFYGNVASTANGGAIDNVFSASLTLIQCTFSSNNAGGLGGAIDNYLSQVNLTNSIVAANAGSDIYNWSGSVVAAGGSNIVQSLGNAGTLTGAETVIATNPLLGPLANNGGRTKTMMPQTGSPAIDAAVSSAAASLSYDQRGPGYPRFVGDAVDIGAVEAGIVPYVFNLADSGYGSLRYAVNYTTNNSIITFATNLSGQTILVTNGPFALTQSLAIDGSTLANSIRLDGNHNSRLFNINGGANVALNALVITNGYTSSGNWGGAILNGGTLSLNNCTLAGNSGDGSVAGGAIANQGPLTMTGCTLAGNSAGFSGAIDNRSTCILQNCTLAGNAASAGNGGAIDNPFGATLTILQCTFSGNSATGAGGAIDNYQSQVNITNSIAAGNGGLDIYNWAGSTVTAGGTNIIPVLSSAGTVIGAGSIITPDPLLAPLANNGGRTQSTLPQPGSPAINAGVTSAAAGLTYDQRGPGYPRVVGNAVDIGAVEVQILISPNPARLTGLSLLGNGSFAFSFTNLSGASFTVFASTNVAQPANTWSNIGPALETPPGSGHFQFTDPQATNYPRRFYRVRSP